MHIAPLRARDRLRIAELLRHDHGYAVRVNGVPSDESDVDDLLTSRPAGTSPDQLHSFGLWLDEASLAALAVVMVDWPQAGQNWVGLLQADSRHSGQGHGRRLHDELLRRLPSACWRLAVVDSNAEAISFWERLGYRLTEERKPWTSPAGEQRTALIMELSIPQTD
ncbi:GNAT family N-acetyltransferase [Luteococcus sp. OSA5]|uniref:GNAT family N-acetyltransferase n=1 Tax=Luteococcus sp. OSA5 TaxID=3401630 RepID=UPI003B43A35B